MYLNRTKKKIEDFVKKRKVVLQSDVQFLGKDKMQVHYVQVKQILSDLEKEKRILRTPLKLGKRTFIEIRWTEKRNG